MSDTVLEVARYFTAILYKNTETHLSWGNSPLTVRIDRGLYIYDFEHNVVSYRRSLSLCSMALAHRKHLPCKRLFKDLFVNDAISNQDLTRCRVDSNLWAHDENMAKDLIHIQMQEWFVLDPHNSILAILTNAGSIDLYIPNGLDYKFILCLSDVLEEKYVQEKVIMKSKDINKLSGMCMKVLSSAFCWGPKSQINEPIINQYFITAQRDGDILFWNLEFTKDISATIQAKLCSILEGENEEIINLKCLEQEHDSFILICSLLYGKLIAYSCKVIKNEVVVLKNDLLWDCDDKMPIKYLLHYEINGKIVLVYNKHRHVVTQLLDLELNTLDINVKNINDDKIVGLVDINGKYVVGTYLCELFVVNLNICDSKLKLDYQQIQMNNLVPSQYFLNGFDVSRNKLLFALNMSTRKVEARKLVKKLKIYILYFGENDQKEINVLLNNPTQKLTYMSDCIELLKFKANMFKLIPDINYDTLWYESHDNIYKLKIYLILIILYNNRVLYSSNKDKFVLPETSVEKIMDTIFMRHSVDVLKFFLNMYKEGGSLTESQKEVYYGCKFKLEDFCKKYNRQINNIFIDELDQKIKLEYTCQCCDKKLEGFSCKDNHLNQFCSVTFTPITSESYLVCTACSSTASYKLKSEQLSCTLCDLPFIDKILW